MQSRCEVVTGLLLPEIFLKNPEIILKIFQEILRKSGIILKSHAENFSDAAIIAFLQNFSGKIFQRYSAGRTELFSHMTARPVVPDNWRRLRCRPRAREIPAEHPPNPSYPLPLPRG